MKYNREKITQAIREEGRKAAWDGKHPDMNPYPVYTMDRVQWNRGYCEGCDEIEARELNVQS